MLEPMPNSPQTSPQPRLRLDPTWLPPDGVLKWPLAPLYGNRPFLARGSLFWQEAPFYGNRLPFMAIGSLLWLVRPF